MPSNRIYRIGSLCFLSLFLSLGLVFLKAGVTYAETPSIAITGIQDGEVLAGMVEINVTVTDAVKVDFYTSNLVSQKSTYLGRAQKKTATEWIFAWDTGYIQDGEYNLQIQAQTDTGMTFSGQEVRVQVANRTDITPTPDPVDDPSVTTAAEILTPLNLAQLRGEVEVKVGGEAKSVDVFSRALASDRTDYIGKALFQSDDTWLLSWNTGLLPEGEYRLYAVLYQTGSREMTTEEITVELSGSETAQAETALDPDAVVESYTILEQDYPQLIAVNDTNRVAAVMGADADSSFTDMASITQIGIYKINLSTNPGMEIVTGKIVMTGHGPANTRITISVFSEPIVATTTTDENGNWVYTIDSSLEQGKHEVYMTVGDSHSKYTGRSHLWEFMVKEAVAAQNEVSDTITSVSGSNRSLLERYSYAVGGVVICVLVLFLVIQRSSKNNS